MPTCCPKATHPVLICPDEGRCGAQCRKAQRRSGEPLLSDGHLVASVWAGPTHHRGYPSTVHLTDIMSSLRGSQEEGTSGHQGQPPSGVHARSSCTRATGHSSQRRPWSTQEPELKPSSHSGCIYKAPQAAGDFSPVLHFSKVNGLHCAQRREKQSIGKILTPNYEDVIRTMEETQETYP